MQQQTSTGATNVEYDIISELHSLLKGNAALEQYIQDAKQAGDSEVEGCFKQILDQNRQHVSSLRELLAERFSQDMRQKKAA